MGPNAWPKYFMTITEDGITEIATTPGLAYTLSVSGNLGGGTLSLEWQDDVGAWTVYSQAVFTEPGIATVEGVSALARLQLSGASGPYIVAMLARAQDVSRVQVIASEQSLNVNTGEGDVLGDGGASGGIGGSISVKGGPTGIDGNVGGGPGGYFRADGGNGDDDFEYAGASGGYIDISGGRNGGMGGVFEAKGAMSDAGNSCGGVIRANASAVGFSGGNINLNAYPEDNPAWGGAPGSIDMHGYADQVAGSLSTYGGDNGFGGNIDTSNGGGNILTNGSSAGWNGGTIDTRGGSLASGGSINTSNGGGGINTSNGGGAINTSTNGGSIQTFGSVDGGTGGSINTTGGSGYSGGNITTCSGDGGSGGYIDTSSHAPGTRNGGCVDTHGEDGQGGNIITAGYGGYRGGDILTHSGMGLHGGNINTTAGGNLVSGPPIANAVVVVTTGNATSGSVTTTHYLTIYDKNGTAWKVPVQAA